MKYNTRTKIICTLGPASNDVQTIQRLFSSGMDVARLNFSHNTHSFHAKLIQTIRRVCKERKKSIAILQDLQGPKIRLGIVPEKGVPIFSGQEIIFQTGRSVFSEKQKNILPVPYKHLHKDIKKQERIFLDDGLLEAVVTRVHSNNIYAKVVTGGILFSQKGINFPDTHLSVAAFTEKDKADLLFGLKKGVDWVALSFVTSKQDVVRVRSFCRKHCLKNQIPPRLLVKIEKHEALESFEEILSVADGILVARGDLGVEIPAEVVPLRQKDLIAKCRQAGKPVVVATQMLDSMIRNPRPTRAEVSDVANAVMDHTDAVMLSGETAAGKYPVKAVQMMKRIIMETEKSVFDDVSLEQTCFQKTGHALSRFLHELACKKQIQAIVSAHFFGSWSEQLNRYRPEVPIFLAADQQAILRQEQLLWGVVPFFLKQTTPELFAGRAISVLQKNKLIAPGMSLAIVTGKGQEKGVQIIKI